MVNKLEPTEAQRKAMVDKLGEHVQWSRDGVEMAVDDMLTAANSIADGAPVGTIARRPDGAWIAFVEPAQPGVWLYRQLLAAGQGLPQGRDADSWPQIRPDQWPDQAGLDWFPPGEEPLVPRPDPTAQQEPVESLSRGLDDIAAGRVSRRDDYLEPQQEPATTHPVSPESTNCVPKPRTPRVVDRLGVDEQGSRWLDVFGWVWSFENGWWKTKNGSLDYGCVDPSIRGPFKEILEPRALPSLECEEARDGTEWETVEELPSGGRCSYQYRPWAREWWGRSPNERRDGHPGYPFVDAVKVVGPFREVLGDPS